MTGLDFSKIGGSDMAAILGVSPWAGPWDVWARIKHGVDEQREREWMTAGAQLETPIWEMWASEHDDPNRWTPGHSRRFAAPYEWLRCTPDFEAMDAAEICEVKNLAAFKASQWADGPPDYYMTQVQTYLRALNCDRAWFAVLFGGQTLRSVEVPHDRDLSAMIFGAAAKFWRDFIEGDATPDLDHSRACREAIWRANSKGDVRDADDEEAELIAELQAAEHRIKVDELKIAELKNRLIERIGEDRGVACPIGKVLAIHGKGKKKTDWRAVKANASDDLLELIEQHTTIAPGARYVRGYWT